MSKEMILMLVALGLCLVVLLLLVLPKGPKDIDQIEDFKSEDDGSIISIGHWLLLDILMIIPFVNLIVLLIYALSNSKKSLALKSWSRYSLFMLFLPILALGVWFLISVFNNLKGGLSMDQIINLAIGIIIVLIPIVTCLIGLFKKDKATLNQIRTYEFKWLGLYIMCSIPLVNLIYLISYISIHRDRKNKSLLNWATLQLIFLVIILIAIGTVIGLAFAFPQEFQEIMAQLDTYFNDLLVQFDTPIQ